MNKSGFRDYVLFLTLRRFSRGGRGRKAEKTICLRGKREQSGVKFGFDQKAAIVASPHRPFPKQAPAAGADMKSFLLYGPADASQWHDPPLEVSPKNQSTPMVMHGKFVSKSSSFSIKCR
jgi:hypothetical protein